MMNVKFFMHDILTDAGNFNKIFPCNIQNVQAGSTWDITGTADIAFPADKLVILGFLYSVFQLMSRASAWASIDSANRMFPL